MASTLRRNIRSCDLVGRRGGEEFLAIIANVDTAQLQAMAEKLRILAGQAAVGCAAKLIQVPVSVGAALTRRAETIEGLLH